MTQARRKKKWPKPTTPPPDGRVGVEGIIVSLKERETEYGVEFKMTVRLDDGNMVWATLPIGLRDAYRFADTDKEFLDWYRGKRVRFTATFHPSDRDPHFAFGKRPARARFVEEEKDDA